MLIGKRANKYLNDVHKESAMIELKGKNSEYVNPDIPRLFLVAIGSLNNAASHILDLKFDNSDALTAETKNSLISCSQFFDYLIKSGIYSQRDNDYYYLLSSVGYYFCDCFSSSKLMYSSIISLNNADGHGFDEAIYQVISNENKTIDFSDQPFNFKNEIRDLLKSYNNFKSCGDEDIKDKLNVLSKDNIYKKVLYGGTSREFFLCELLLALIKMKILNSKRLLLPNYTNIPFNIWEQNFKKNFPPDELSLLQRKLGKEGFFRGKSGIIIMPISSEKIITICTILQSQFINNPNSITVIIEPNALSCTQITQILKNQFKNSTVFISIMNFSNIYRQIFVAESPILSVNSIFVLSVKELLSLIKLDSNFLSYISTIVFDNADLFSESAHATLYELLIATVKEFQNNSVQIILFSSSTIPNKDKIQKWLFGKEEGCYISLSSFKSSQKSFAINDISKDLEFKNNLTYIDPKNPDNDLFSIPCIIQVELLNKIKKTERKKRYFPSIDDSNSLSIYYSSKLLKMGTVAIFCGRYDSVSKLIKDIIELEKRDFDLSEFKRNCNEAEREKIKNLISKNLGNSSEYTLGAELGIFPYHPYIPIGIKKSVLYALSNELIKLVVFSSKLPDNTSVPIKYLILSSIYENKNVISVRQFQNMIGKNDNYSPGTVIFSHSYKNNWRNQDNNYRYRNLIKGEISEDCLSSIYRLFKIEEYFSFDTIIEKYENYNSYKNKISDFKSNSSRKEQQFKFQDTIKAIESTLTGIEEYITIFGNRENNDLTLKELKKIVKRTLGYYQAKENEQLNILKLFETIFKKYANLQKTEKKSLSQTQLGIIKGFELLNWTKKNSQDLLNVKSNSDIINLVLSEAIKLTNSSVIKVINKLNDKNTLTEICGMWINGLDYYCIREYSDKLGLKIKRKKNEGYKGLKNDEIIKLCDLFFSQDFSETIFSIFTILKENYYHDQINTDNENKLSLFQKKLKYGLPNQSSIKIYNLGFKDRYIAQLIAKKLKLENVTAKSQTIRNILIENSDTLKEILKSYPSYFINVIDNL